MKLHNKLWWGMACVLAVQVLFLIHACDRAILSQTPRTYPASLTSTNQIYDGDTLKRVHIAIKTFPDADFSEQTLWPGIVLKGDTLYAVTDIRIQGIDTPEKRPLKAGRTQESLLREKAAAAAATDALRRLLSQHNFHIVVAQPQQGKYAGRIVAAVHVGPNRLSVAEYLIKNGHATPYDGGTKTAFEDWYQKDN